jgi:hypothetical protein
MELTQKCMPFAKMPHKMLKFGSANNFSGNIREWALKRIVKDHAEKTQRQPDKFAEQCAICEYERDVIKYVMTRICCVRRRGSLHAKLASARPTVIDGARPSTRPPGSPPIPPDIYRSPVKGFSRRGPLTSSHEGQSHHCRWRRQTKN